MITNTAQKHSRITNFQITKLHSRYGIRQLCKKLTAEHFSWLPFGLNIGISEKREILYGMASGFNHSDIYHFAVLNQFACDKEPQRINKILFKALEQKHNDSIATQIIEDIHWVISLPTAVHIIENIKIPRTLKK